MTNKKKWIGWLIRLMWVGYWVGLFGVVFLIVGIRYNLMGWFGESPGLRELERPEENVATEVFYADGSLMGKYYFENRIPVTYDELSDYLIEALVATEDARFEEHSGIDFYSVMRVVVKTLAGGQKTGYGSTVSQQLARNLYDMRYDERFEGAMYKVGPLRPFIIKLKEWMVAIDLERNYTKEEITYMFLNTLSYGNNLWGIKVASNTYYNKEPHELEMHEAAALIAIINNQTYFNPLRYPERTEARTDWVISQMHKYGYITEEEKQANLGVPLGLDYNPESHYQGTAQYFRSAIRQELKNWIADQNEELNLFNSGLKIYTTLDSRLQQYAERAVKDHMAYLQGVFNEHWKGRNPWTDANFREIPGYLEQATRQSRRYRVLENRHGADSAWQIMTTPVKMRVFTYEGDKEVTMSPMDSIAYYKRFLHTGFMVMDPHTGHIKSWVGGVDHSYFQYDHVRQGQNQPGSTFKPILYATAIDLGYPPCYLLTDEEVTYEIPGSNDYTPQNSTQKYDGQTMTMRQAMGRSVNRVAVAMIDELGPERVVQMARRLGITSDLNPVLSLALGTSDVSVYEMVAAYSTFVNQGTYTEPMFIQRIEDKNGVVLRQDVPRRKDALSEESAYLMLHMLRGATEEVGGTATGLHPEILRDNEVGGKTGTTSNYADGWFMGVTKDLVGGVWVGGDDNSIKFRSFQYGQGARMAMPIWEKFMLQVYRDPALDYEKGPFPRPSQPLSVNLDCSKYATSDSARVQDDDITMDDIQ